MRIFEPAKKTCACDFYIVAQKMLRDTKCYSLGYMAKRVPSELLYSPDGMEKRPSMANRT